MQAHPVAESYELSPLQQGMLIHTLRDTGVGMYFSQAVFTLTGIDPDAFGRAWQRLVDRHSILRTSFAWEGLQSPVQRVHPELEIAIQTEDWRAAGSEGEREARFKEFLREDRERGFDLSAPPLMRLFLFRIAEERWRFVFSHHHLLLDGWSNPLLMGEVRRLYEAERRGQALELPPARPYRHYIEWLRAQDSAKAEAFWRRHLAGIQAPTPLPADLGARRKRATRLHFGEWDARLDATLVAALQRLARGRQVTLNTLLLAAWAILLSRYSGESDVVIGMLVSGRPPDLDGVESMIGMFLNTLPCRIRVDEAAPLGSWLQGIQAQQFALQQYEHSPLRSVQAWSQVPPGVPLFECVVDNNNTPLERADGQSKPGSDRSLDPNRGGMVRKEVTSRAVHQNIPFHLDIEAEGAELVATITYDARRFEHAAVVRVSGQYQALLRTIAEHPERCLGDLSMLSETERVQVLDEWNRTARPYPEDLCLHQLFEQQAARTPEAIAVRFGDRSLSYRALNARANALAAHLRAQGAGPERIVGLCVRRSPDLALALLGILKAGAAYLPLDPSFPAARLKFILADAGVALLVAEAAVLKALPAINGPLIRIDDAGADWAEGTEGNLQQESPENLVTPEDLAYVLYTSGSTGAPKGVAIPHRVPVARLYAEDDPFEPGEALCAKTTLNFVDAVWELFSAWRHGLCATLIPEDDVKDPLALIAALATAGATRLVLVPSLLRALLDSGVDLARKLPRLRHFISSGEPLPADLCQRFSEALPAAVLTNLYGTSEVWDATRSDSRRHPPGAPLPIGRPLPNARVYVLDERLRPVPVGVAGELHVGGAYLARGYHRRPDLTAERFVADPFTAGGRLYRTGDSVRWRADGNLEYLGRSDQQIKLRGFRIELTEIEAALQGQDGVRQAAVALSEDERPESQHLVAYIAPEPGHTPRGKTLQAELSKALPAHMVPAFYQLLEALPLTPNGKLDRRALSALALEERQATAPEGEEAADFATATEEKIAQVWGELLKVSGIGRASHFFALGGHSLMATRVAMRLGKELGIKLPLGRVFELPVLSALAEWIDKTLAGEATQAEQIPELARAARGKEAPLSFAQQRLWVLDQLNPGGLSYTVPNLIRFVGEFKIAAMRQALADLVQRHESLRTTFIARDGEPYQIVHPTLTVDLPLIDLTGLPAGERDAAAQERLRAQARQPWDLVDGPLFRAQILRLDPERHAFVLTMHHIMTDGRSMGVLTRELSLLYQAARDGRPSPLPPLRVQYADFAIWQRDWMKGELLEKQLAYWRDQLGDAALLDLPTDRPRPLAHRYRGAQGKLEIPPPVVQALRALAGAEDATLFMALLAGFQLLLARYAGHADISVGTPSANRNREELEGIIGFFVNVLVMRTDLSGNPSFRGLLRRVRATCVGAYDNQDVPFDKLVEVLNPQRDLSGQPLFQAMFVHELVKQGGMDLPGVKWEHSSTEMETANFDLLLVARESEDRIACTLQYNADLFEPATIERMCAHLGLLLERLTKDPDAPLSAIAMLSAAERRQVLVDWNATDTQSGPDLCIHELIAAHARADPQAPALWYQGETLSRGELDARANRLARRLADLGCGPERIVGLCLPRSFELIVGLLGILESGSAFLPLDPDYPPERLEYMIQDSGVEHVVTAEDLAGLLPVPAERLLFLDPAADAEAAKERTGESKPDPGCPETGVAPANLAYVIYTSGSTGTPKGMQLEHHNLVSLVRAHNPAFGIDEKSRILQMLSISFDAGVGEIFRALAGGALLHLAPKDDLLPGPGLVKLLQARHITHAAIPPAVLAAMPAGAEAALPELAWLVTAGEAFSPELAQRWGRGRHLITGHGATETTVGDTIAVDWDLTRKPPLGVPLPNMKAYVLDAWGEPVPIGTPGELHISGPQVGRGYLGNPALTAERFVPDPFTDRPGARMYRTGDMVRWLGSGALDFIGRADQQVKIRGYRIELGEIEAVLATHPQVGQAVVAVTTEGGVKRLVGYFVAKHAGGAPDPAGVRAFLKERLPEHMIPAFLMRLAAIPRTANNKIDRRALPRPDPASLTLQANYRAPRNPTETGLAAIWAEVLGLEQVGIEDNFFELGGDSIMSIQVVARANKAGIGFTARDLFAHQTIAALAAQIAAGTTAVAAEQGIVTGAVPLTPVQEWFFAADPPVPQHYNQWLTRSLPGAHDAEQMRAALQAVLAQHDALRLRFARTDTGWRAHMAPLGEDSPFVRFDLGELTPQQRAERIAAVSAELQAGLDLAQGPILRMAWFEPGSGRDGQLLVLVHHLAMDNVSWPFLMEDFFTAYRQLRAGQAVGLQPKTTSFKQWAETLQDFAASAAIQQELPYWLDARRTEAARLPRDFPDGGIAKAASDSVYVALDAATTELLLRTALRLFKVQINDLLLTALGSALCRWTGRARTLVNVEGHGREEIGEKTNVSRTIGWFTSFYPVLLELDLNASAHDRLQAVSAQLARIPNRGMGYSLLRYLAPDPDVRAQLAQLPDGEVAFNYTGQQAREDDGQAAGAPDQREGQIRLSESGEGTRHHPIEIVGAVLGGALNLRWVYSREQYRAATIEHLAADFIAELRLLAAAAEQAREQGALREAAA